MREHLWKIILIVDAMLMVIGIVVYAYGMQPIHVTRIARPPVVELESFTLYPGEKYSDEFWVELNERPLVWYDPESALVFDYNVSGFVEVVLKSPEDTNITARHFPITDYYGGVPGTMKLQVWLSGLYEISLTPYGDLEAVYPVVPTQATIFSLKVTNEYYGLRENPLMMTEGASLAFVGLVTSGAGVGLMMMRRSVETKASRSSPRPSTLPTRRSRDMLVIAAILTAIILGISIYTYVEAGASVTSAMDSCYPEVGYCDVTITGSLPLSAIIETDFTIENPSGMNLYLNRYQAEIIIIYGDVSYDLGSVDLADKSLPAYSQVSVHLSMPADTTTHGGTNVVSILTAHRTGYNILVSYTFSATGTWSFWTVTEEVTGGLEWQQL